MTSWSLRGRLTAAIAVATLVAWAGAGAWLYRESVEQTGRLYDAALAETAHVLLGVLAHEGIKRDGEVELDEFEHNHIERLVYQVRARGKLVWSSRGAPVTELAGPQARGFTDAVVDGIQYRVYSLDARKGRVLIHVGQTLLERKTGARETAVRLLLPAAAAALVLAIAVALVVRRVTTPLVRFSQSIDAREPGDAAEMDVSGLPAEVQPVGAAINRLLKRIEHALLAERTLTADAAHELRTPLAALRAQAQVALRSADDVERSAALASLVGGVDRASRMVDTVLTLARLDVKTLVLATLPRVRLDDLAAVLVRETGSTASRRGVRVVSNVGAIEVRADADALAIALRNLIDNALRHARAQVTLHASLEQGRVRIIVADDGVGFAADVAERAFDRFHRGDAAGAAGLGLAMVRRVAELHGGSAQLLPNKDGARVAIEWPVA